MWMGEMQGLNIAASRCSGDARAYEIWQTPGVEKSRSVLGGAVAACVLGVAWVRFLTAILRRSSLFCFRTHTNTPAHTRIHTHTHPRIYQGGKGLLALKSRRQINSGHQEPVETYQTKSHKLQHMQAITHIAPGVRDVASAKGSYSESYKRD